MPASAMSFRNYVLNQRVDASAPFLNMAVWKANGNNEYGMRELKGRPCYAGLDLGATKDMTALVLVFADRGRRFRRYSVLLVALARRCRSAKTKTTCRTRMGAGRELAPVPRSIDRSEGRGHEDRRVSWHVQYPGAGVRSLAES